MKQLVLTSALLAICAQVAVADTLIRTENRTEVWEGGEKVSSEKTGDEQFWIGEGRAAYIIEGRTIVVDREKGRLLFIRPAKKFYLETPLPFDLEEVLSDQLKFYYQHGKAAGTVEKTEETRKIHDLECVKYVYTQWEQAGDQRLNERVITVWATEGLDCGRAEHDLLLECMRKIYGRKEALLAELAKIKGKQMLLEMVVEENGKETRFIQEVVEVAEKDPPEGTYDVPEEFAKKDKLRSLDLL